MATTALTPRRVQRRRIPGWRMPTCGCGCGKPARYVGRGSRWGNPFRVGKTTTLWAQDHRTTVEADLRPRTVSDAVALYRQYITVGVDVFGSVLTSPDVDMEAIRQQLAGHDLACWCPLVTRTGSPHPCHADVLLELAAVPAGSDLR